MTKPILLILLLLALSIAWGCKKNKPAEPEPEPKYEFRHDGNLEIIGKNGAVKASFEIEIVEKEEEVMRGLKYRDAMAANQGMLFIFATPDYYDFWMQDTYLPLDMLFISLDKTIFQIHENAQPFSEQRISPTQPNSYVLELNAGIANKMNIKTGVRISWKSLP